MQVKAKVFVQGDAFHGITERIFQKHDGKYLYETVNKLEDAQICVWTGGEDISPQVYDEKPMPGTYFSHHRDVSDLEAVKEAVDKHKFLVGICRGAQLLNCVPNGGKLWQDVDGHNGCNHLAFDCVEGKWITINSVHHQMCRLTDKAEMICWAKESTRRNSPNYQWRKPHYHKDSVILEKDKDPEAWFYPDTDSLCVQFHPEFGHPPTTKYFFGLLEKYYWGKYEQETEIAA